MRLGNTPERVLAGAAALLLALVPGFAKDRSALLDAVLRKYAGSGQFSGTALVAEGEKILLEKGYGFASLEWDVPNGPRTRFQIGSVN